MEKATKDSQEEENQNRQRDNIPRKGVASSRPSRRVVEGHTKACIECGVVDWSQDNSRGEVSCNSCGLVVDENVIDPGAEWTNYSDGADRSRVGAPKSHTLADGGLNTSISLNDLTSGAAARLGMNSRARSEWRRRRTTDERSKTRQSRHRNLVKANQTIRDRSGLPKPLQEEACMLYRRLSEEGFVTGRSIAGITAACTYLVAREENLPKQIPDICEAFDIGVKEVSRMIRQISSKFGMHKVTKPTEYFPKFLSQLGMPPAVIQKVNELWKIIEEHSELWQAKKPAGVAAALIYLAGKTSGNVRTQAEVCEVAKISEVTLRGLIKIIDALMVRASESNMN